jgi:Flp pilus assembly protein TadG
MHQLMKRFLTDRSGNILMITGLGFLFLVAIGGAGYDLGKQQLVKQRIQQATDAAATSAASINFVTSSTNRELMARTIYALNYPDTYLGVARPPVDVVLNLPSNVVVRAASSVPTSFVGNFGIATLDAGGRSVAQIRRPPTPLDVILVLDNSGSMRATDVGAGSFLDGDIALATVACTAEYSNPAQVAYMTTNPSYTPPGYPAPFYLNAYRSACANPNAGTVFGMLGRQLHGLVGSTRLNSLRRAADNIANSLLNPNPLGNRIAIVKWDNILVGSNDFSNSYTAVRASLMGMFAGVDTNSTVGLQQAEVFAAGFRSNSDMSHASAVILLTDGGNNSMSTQNPASLALCNTLKARQNTLVFTIAFGPVIDDATFGPTVRQFLSDCATGPNGTTSGTKPNENLFFFPVSNSAALAAAFTSISDTLQKVQLMQ